MKPLIIKRQWWRIWRHRALPWGWEEARHIKPPPEPAYLRVDGHQTPGDGDGGMFVFRRPSDDPPAIYNGGMWIAPNYTHKKHGQLQRNKP